MKRLLVLFFCFFWGGYLNLISSQSNLNFKAFSKDTANSFKDLKSNNEEAVYNYILAFEIPDSYGGASNSGIKIEYYTKAITLDDSFIDAYLNRGFEYAKLGQNTEALEDFNKAISIDNTNPKGFVNRGLIFSIIKSREKAISDFKKAIELNPKYALSYANLGREYHLIGDSKKAITVFNDGIKAAPNFGELYKNRGIAKKALHISHCDDYKKACELGTYECCGWYDRDCK